MFKFLKDTHKLAWCGMLSALSFVLSLIEIPTPFQSYLSIDFSEVPILLGAYSLGGGGLIIISILRSLLRFMVKGTLIFGEIAAICASIVCGFVFIYMNKAKKSRKTREFIVLPIIILSIIISTILLLKSPNYLLIGLFVTLLPVVGIIVIILIPKIDNQTKNFAIESIVSIMIVTIFMTIVNFLFITPSNFLAEFASYKTILKMGISMEDYLNIYILPLIPFNILKYTIVFVVSYLIRRVFKLIKIKESN